MLKAKIIVKHRPDCRAVEIVKKGEWSNPWTGLVNEHYWGDAIGRRGNGGMYIWYLMRCNSSNQCPAIKIINGDAIAEIWGEYEVGSRNRED